MIGMGGLGANDLLIVGTIYYHIRTIYLYKDLKVKHTIYVHNMVLLQLIERSYTVLQLMQRTEVNM